VWLPLVAGKADSTENWIDGVIHRNETDTTRLRRKDSGATGWFLTKCFCNTQSDDSS